MTAETQQGAEEAGAQERKSASNASLSDVNPASAESVGEYRAAPVMRHEHWESSLTRLLEQQTAKIPSDVFLFSSLCAMGLSAGLEVAGRERLGRFVGQWVTPLLVMGVYNKMVKTFGAR